MAEPLTDEELAYVRRVLADPGPYAEEWSDLSLHGLLATMDRLHEQLAQVTAERDMWKARALGKLKEQTGTLRDKYVDAAKERDRLREELANERIADGHYFVTLDDGVRTLRSVERLRRERDAFAKLVVALVDKMWSANVSALERAGLADLVKRAREVCDG